MMIETKTTFQLADVKAIELECANCGAQSVIPLAQFTNPPIRCTVCDSSQWLVPGSDDFRDLVQLVRTMERFSQSNGKLFRLRFQLKEVKP